jgi:hypothetical protein
MRVLADFHHGGLFESLRLLFEERFGWELYRPIGLDWYQEGYWAVYNHLDTAVQYLGMQLTEEYQDYRRRRPDAEALNQGAMPKGDGTFVIPSQEWGKSHRGVTLSAFREMPFDIMLSSMPAHFRHFERLRSECQPNAKHIFQMGNNWDVPEGCVNLLDSTSSPHAAGIHAVRYHQEFDLNVFRGKTCHQPKSVLNLMHYQASRYAKEFEDFESKFVGWKFSNHGCGNRDGVVHPVTRIPDVINEHGFLWHNKPGGEGYGYNMHQALAMGRPIICHRSLYRGNAIEKLLVDGVSCFDLDNTSDPLTILNWAVNDWFQRYADTIGIFRKYVDFDAEAEEIKAFLANLRG